MKIVVAILLYLALMPIFAQDSKFSLCTEIGDAAIQSYDRRVNGATEITWLTHKNPYIKHMLYRAAVFGYTVAQSRDDAARYGRNYCLSHPYWNKFKGG